MSFCVMCSVKHIAENYSLIVMCDSIDNVIIVLQKPLLWYDNSLIIVSMSFDL